MTADNPGWYRWEQEDLLLNLWIQPRSSRNEFTAPHGDRYKVCITAPPVDGEANAHLIRFLAKAFGVPRRQINIETGETARNKGIRIHQPKKFPIPIKEG